MFPIARAYIDISSEWKKGKIALSKKYNRPYTIDNLQVRWKWRFSLWFYPRCCFIFSLSLTHSLTVDSQYSIGSRNTFSHCMQLLSSCANINCAYLIALALCAVIIMYFFSFSCPPDIIFVLNNSHASTCELFRDKMLSITCNAVHIYWLSTLLTFNILMWNAN